MNKLLGLLALCAAISGCDKFNQVTTTTTCSDSDGVKTAKSLFSDEIAKQLSDLKSQDGSRLFDQAGIRATLAKIDISFESIRTSKTDPNSTKVFCTASVKATIPPELLGTANKGFQITKSRKSVEDSASEYGLSGTANSFARDVDYDLQPTDNREEIYAHVANGEPIINFASEVATAILIVPMAEAKEAEDARAAAAANAQQAVAQMQEDQQKSEKLQADLIAAQEENSVAKSSLNTAWSSIPADRQAELTSSQKEWVQNRKDACQTEATQSAGDDSAQIPLLELQCETTKIKERTEQLGNTQSQSTE